MNNQKIINLRDPDPFTNSDAVNVGFLKAYVDSKIVGTAPAGPTKQKQVFSTPGTYIWVRPAGVNSVDVTMVGGGSGGVTGRGGGSGPSGHGGPGGGGGQALKFSASVFSNVTVIVGAGGAGSVTTPDGGIISPGSGGNTFFGSFKAAGAVINGESAGIGGGGTAPNTNGSVTNLADGTVVFNGGGGGADGSITPNGQIGGSAGYVAGLQLGGNYGAKAIINSFDFYIRGGSGGGATFFSPGGKGGDSKSAFSSGTGTAGSGQRGPGYGAGGGGGGGADGGGTYPGPGGAGADGVVIVEWLQ